MHNATSEDRYTVIHVNNCRDRHIISSGFQEKGGCPLIRACSVITSNTVCLYNLYYAYIIYIGARSSGNGGTLLLYFALVGLFLIYPRLSKITTGTT